MKIINKMMYSTKQIVITMLLLLTVSCSDFVEPALPPGQLAPSKVFSNDASLKGVVKGAYAYINIVAQELFWFPSFLSDELISKAASGALYNMQRSTYSADDAGVFSRFLSNLYNAIYNCNAILEALETPNDNLTPSLVNQAKGEARFLRAYSYFHLVNLFGPVPLIKTTDVNVTATKGNTPVDITYKSIINDLLIAKDLITNAYPTTGRFRVNKQAVHTLLAKVYLYRKKWEKAEKYATYVIESGLYSLVPVDKVFSGDSNETIWQFWNANGYTALGLTYTPTNPTSVYYQVRVGLVNAFEAGDLRKTAWLQHGTGPAKDVYYPSKYKTSENLSSPQYLIQFRLAELYLIRAEARAHQNELAGAVEDLVLLRARADLTAPLTLTTKQEVLEMVAQERRRELMFENANRWYDLKRTGRAVAVLSQIKDHFRERALLLPFPLSQLTQNPNLEQNPGY